MKRNPVVRGGRPGGFRAHSAIAQWSGPGPDKPFLDLHATGYVTELSWKNLGGDFPHQIVLKVRIQPVPLKDRSATAQLRINGQSFEPQNLYEKGRIEPKPLFEGSGIGAIELYTDGSGEVEKEQGQALTPFQRGELGEGMWIQVEMDPLEHNPFETKKELFLYHKPFAVEETKQALETRTYLEDGRIFVSSVKRFDAERVLRPHSGYCPKGCGLQDIQQVYYSLSERGGKTQVTLSLANAWDAKKTHAGTSGIYFASLGGEEDSFVKTLESGEITLWVRSPWGRKNYLALAYKERPNDPEHVDLIFSSEIIAK